MRSTKNGIWIAASLLSLGLIAGCPNVDLGPLASDLLTGVGSDTGTGSGTGSDRQIIPDGSYGGDISATAQIWYNGQQVDQMTGGGELSGTFANGAVLNDSGEKIRIGDVIKGNWGAFQATRTVSDIKVGNWACEVSFDVEGQLDNVPLGGTEVMTFTLNADGTIDMEDTMELFSQNKKSGDVLEIDVDMYGTLCSCRESGSSSSSDQGSGNSSGTQSPSQGSGTPSGTSSPSGIWHPSNPLFDLKSGKSRHND